MEKRNTNYERIVMLMAFEEGNRVTTNNGLVIMSTSPNQWLNVEHQKLTLHWRSMDTIELRFKLFSQAIIRS